MFNLVQWFTKKWDQTGYHRSEQEFNRCLTQRGRAGLMVKTELRSNSFDGGVKLVERLPQMWGQTYPMNNAKVGSYGYLRVVVNLVNT